MTSIYLRTLLDPTRVEHLAICTECSLDSDVMLVLLIFVRGLSLTAVLLTVVPVCMVIAYIMLAGDTGNAGRQM